MPGLIGLVSTSPGSTARAPFEGMLAAMERGGRLHSESVFPPEAGWAVGRVHLGILNPTPQLEQDGALEVLFQGDLDNAAELWETLGEFDSDGGRAVTRLLAVLYRRYGAALAARLKGAFCAVILDAEAGKVVLINDRLGSYPLYWHRGERFFAFSSELQSLLRAPDLRARLNARAVADYIRFGFLLGEKTLADAVELVPPGSILEFDWRRGELRTEIYFELASLFDSSGAAGSLDDVCEAFNIAVERTLGGRHDFVLAVSGGMDSRAILSAVVAAGEQVRTYTTGVRACADDVIAKRLARLTGADHRFFELDDSYLSGFLPNLREMIKLTDGMYLTHGLTEMLALGFFGAESYEVLLRGHGGELAKTSLAWPLHTDARIAAMEDAEALVPYLLQRIDYISGDDMPAELFTPDWHERIRDGAKRSLRESLGALGLSAADACSYLYLQEHHRRFTVPSLEIFRNTLEVRLPFVDIDFLSALFRLPADRRETTAIHKAIVARNQPSLARVRNSNTGAPAGAGPLTEYVLDKFNSLFKRLNLPGYRHYHRFDAWMQSTLLETVEATLLDPGAHSSVITRREGVAKLVEETRTGAKDHGYLLQVLLILELWQRDFLSA